MDHFVCMNECDDIIKNRGKIALLLHGMNYEWTNYYYHKC